MEGAQLKEYLKVAIDMEQSIYIQERALRSFPAFTPVSSKVPECPSTPAAPSPKPKLLSDKLGTGAILLLIGALCFVFIVTLYDTAISWMEADNILIVLLGICLGLLILCAPIAGIYAIGWGLFQCGAGIVKLISYPIRMQKWKKENAAYIAAISQYNQQHTKHIQQTIAAKMSDAKYNEAAKEVYDAELSRLKSQLAQSRANLQKLYSLNVIFPKYRNLPMLCSLYEYICAGRCTTLEGHEGGYNILESEMRLDRIVTQMDSVLSNLSRIQQNQYLLHATMQDSVRRTDQLISSTNKMIASAGSMASALSSQSKSLEDIQKNSAITAYCLEENRKELEYMKRYL